MNASVPTLRCPPLGGASRELHSAFASDWRTRLHTWLLALESPWLAYVTVFLLQFKLISADWEHRDLTGGDSASYYWSATRLHDTGVVDLIWSPLYQAYVGVLLSLSRDAYFVTILHRWLIILGSTLLLLWVFRRLMPHGLALLLTAWWALLRSNYNVMYEVHLFVVAPLLIAVGLLANNPRPWRRGVAIGILVLTGLLLRNEFSILALLVLVGSMLVEARRIASSPGRRARVAAKSLLSYGLPGVATLLILGVFYVHALVGFPDLLVVSQPKHTLNVCQVYAFSYQQRHSDWTKNPWLDCEELMQRDFGEPLPSALAALRENSPAMLEHFWWNAALTPAGLQVLLFNSTSASISPDFAPVPTDDAQVLVPSVLLLGLLIMGGICLLRDWRYWWTKWIQNNIWAWLCLAGMICVAIPVIVLERPRPEYIFDLGIAILAATGLAAAAVGRKLFRLAHWGPIAVPVVLCLLVLVSPYLADATTSGRRIQLDVYQRVARFSDLLRRQNVVFLGSGTALIAHYYLGGIGDAGFSSTLTGFDYGALQEYQNTQPFQTFLESKGINLVYLDAGALQQLASAPGAQDFLANPESTGWTVVESAVTYDGPWRILKKASWNSR